MQIKQMLKLAICAGAISLGPAFADQWDKKTIITIDAPLQIPTTTLQPGTYTLKLLDSASNRHIVTVWDKDGMHLVATILAIPNYRLKPTGDSKFTTWETPAGQPAALRAWFYPGDNFGQEFKYPRTAAMQIATLTKDEVPALSTLDEARLKESQTTSTTVASSPPQVSEPPAAPPAASAPAVIAQATPPSPPVAAEPEPAALPPSPGEQEQVPETIPSTASDWPAVTLLGVFTAVLALATLRKPRPHLG
jgi:hypothetical protein